MAAAEAALAQVTAAVAAGTLTTVDKGAAADATATAPAGAASDAAATNGAAAPGAMVAGARDAAEAEAEPLTPLPSSEAVARARAQSDAVAKQLSHRLPSSSALPVELARVKSWRPSAKSAAGAESPAAAPSSADATAAPSDAGTDLSGVASAAASSGPPPVVLSIRAPDAPGAPAAAAASGTTASAAAATDIATPLASQLASQAAGSSAGAGTPAVKVVLRHAPRPGPATADSRLAAREVGRSRGASALGTGAGGTPRVPGAGPASTGAGSPAVFGGAGGAAAGADAAATAAAVDANARPITKDTLLLHRVPVTPQGRARIDSLASHTAAALVPGSEEDAPSASGPGASAPAAGAAHSPGGLAAFFRRITGADRRAAAHTGAHLDAGSATGLEMATQGGAPPVRPQATHGDHADDGEGTPLAGAAAGATASTAAAAVGLHIAADSAVDSAATSAPARTTPISHKSSSSAEPPNLDGAHADDADAHAAKAAAAGHASGKGNGKAAAESHGDAHAKEAGGPKPEVEVHYDALHPPSRNEFIIAWAPWAIVCVAVVIWGLPGVKVGLSQATVLVPLNGLNNEVIKPDPARPDHPHKVAAVWTLDFLAATGICLIFCDLVTSAIFRLHPLKTARIMWSSFRRMAFSFLSILLLISFGYVIKMSGQVSEHTH